MRIVKSKRYRLCLGDNMEALAKMPDNSVDAVVTDPPYGLSAEPDPYEMMKQWYKKGHYDHGNKAGFMGNEWDAFVPQPAFWKEVFRVLKPGGHVLAFFGTRTHDLGTLAIRLAGFEIRDTIMWVYGSGFPKSLNIGKKLSELGRKEATEYSGFGTSLKPSLEPICLARKPLEGTVAQNVLKHKTGGINIDGCRVPMSDGKDAEAFEFNHNGSNRSSKKQGDNLGAYEGGWKVQKGEKAIPQGRFPANFIHDGSEDVEKGFPIKQHGDSVSASRFFYCAKASKSDRDEGLRGGKREMKIGATGLRTNPSTGRDRITPARHNIHPTVKPTDLMRYLTRLVCPPNGVVLDPFMGSGSTGKAAMKEGFRFIGMEMSDEYFNIARERIKQAYQTTPTKKKKLF